MRLAPLLLGALAAAAAAPSLPAQGVAHSVTRRLDDDDDGGKSCSAAERVVYDIVETMPIGVNLTYRNSIYNALHTMMTQATKTIDIACFYMELSDGGSSEGAQYGLQLFNDIIDASKRGVRVRIAITSASDSFPQTDAYTLQAMGAAEVRFMDFNAILGGGVLHTKMIIADNATFFVGSANMDWKSFSQVKELGLYGSSSKRLVFQMEQIFNTYWLIGATNSTPVTWPSYYQNAFNWGNPLPACLNGSSGSIVVSVAPPAFQPPGWTADVDDIRGTMADAAQFVWFEVMDYVPAILYNNPSTYWNLIDDMIRTVNYNNQTQFRILIGYWEHSIPNQIYYLQSLNTLPNVEVRYFLVPPIDPPIPFTRVNHAKWMVTDRRLFIGTSNWSGDYFTNTAGVGFSTDNEDAVSLGQSIYERDWNSAYSVPIPAPNATAVHSRA